MRPTSAPCEGHPTGLMAHVNGLNAPINALTQIPQDLLDNYKIVDLFYDPSKNTWYPQLRAKPVENKRINENENNCLHQL